MLPHRTIKFCIFVVMALSLYTTGYTQGATTDTACTTCETHIRSAMQHWKQNILNNDETEPVSFVKLFAVNSEETRQLVLARFTADTTIIGYLYWHNNSEKIKFVRQKEIFGKKVTMLSAGSVSKGKYWTKQELVTLITKHANEIAAYYEVVYKDKDTTVTAPLLCLKTGHTIDALLSSWQFTDNSNW